jgi:hypothetical protein
MAWRWGVAAAVIFGVSLSTAGAAAQLERSPFYSEREQPERSPGSLGIEEEPPHGYGHPTTFFALDAAMAWPLRMEAAVVEMDGLPAEADELSIGPGLGLRGEALTLIERPMLAGLSVAWLHHGWVGGTARFDTFEIDALARALAEIGRWRAWVQLAGGVTMHVRGRRKQMAPALAVGVGVAYATGARWLVNAGVSYRRSLTGEPADESVWAADDPQVLEVVVGAARE